MSGERRISSIYFRRAVWILVAGGLAALAGACFHGSTFDDPFITYRVARNIALGQGWVYNAGENINPVTSPLHTLLLAFLYYIFCIDLPLLGSFLTITGLAVAGFLFPFFCDREKNPAGAYLAGLAVLLYPYLIQSMGMETGLLLAVVMLALFFYHKERTTAAGVMLGLALLLRFDAAILAGLVLLHYLYHRRKAPPLLSLAAFSLVLVPWLLFSVIYFGELLPHTLGVKLAQSRSGGHWGGEWMFMRAFFGVLASFLGKPDVTGLLVWAVAAAGAVHVVKSASSVPRIIAVWAVLHVIAYGLVLRVPPYTWYFAPVYLALAMLLGLGAGALSARLADYKYGGNVLLTAALVFVVIWLAGKALPGFSPLERWFNPVHLGHALGYLALVIGGITFSFDYFRTKGYSKASIAFWIALAAFFPHHLNGYLQMTHGPGSQYVFYRKAAEWIDKNHPHAKTVGAHEIGVLGYFLKDKKIIDQCGIPTPGAAEALGRGNMTWWVKEYRPDVLVLHCSSKWWKEVEGPLLEADWFRKAYHPSAAIISGKRLYEAQAIDLEETGSKSDLPCPGKEVPAKHAVKIWELISESAVPAPEDGPVYKKQEESN